MNYEASFERANAHFSAGRYQEAAEAYREATQGMEPWNAFAWRGLGLSLWQLGKQKEAVEACEKAVEVQFGNVELHYALGYVYAEAGRFADAITELERVLTLRPDHVEAKKTLVYALIQQAKPHIESGPQRAVVPLERAYRLEPENPHVVGPYMDALFRAGLKGKAAQVWVQMSYWLSNHEEVSPVLSKLHADPEFMKVIADFEEHLGSKMGVRPQAMKPKVYESETSRPCPNCAFDIPFGEQFCPRCGFDVRVGAK